MTNLKAGQESSLSKVEPDKNLIEIINKELRFVEINFKRLGNLSIQVDEQPQIVQQATRRAYDAMVGAPPTPSPDELLDAMTVIIGTGMRVFSVPRPPELSIAGSGQYPDPGYNQCVTAYIKNQRERKKTATATTPTAREQQIKDAINTLNIQDMAIRAETTPGNTPSFGDVPMGYVLNVLKQAEGDVAKATKAITNLGAMLWVPNPDGKTFMDTRNLMADNYSSESMGPVGNALVSGKLPGYVVETQGRGAQRPMVDMVVEHTLQHWNDPNIVRDNHKYRYLINNGAPFAQVNVNYTRKGERTIPVGVTLREPVLGLTVSRPIKPVNSPINRLSKLLGRDSLNRFITVDPTEPNPLTSLERTAISLYRNSQ